MEKYKPRPIQNYQAGKTVISARDLNDIVKRLQRLEGMGVVLPLQISNTNPYNIMLSHEVHECKIVVLRDTPADDSDPPVPEGMHKTRDFWYYGYEIELDIDSGYYGHGQAELYTFRESTELRYRFRNPFLFEGDEGDWCFIAKMPSLGDDFMLVQIMCPSESPAPDGHVLPGPFPPSTPGPSTAIPAYPTLVPMING